MNKKKENKTNQIRVMHHVGNMAHF